MNILEHPDKVINVMIELRKKGWRRHQVAAKLTKLGYKSASGTVLTGSDIANFMTKFRVAKNRNYIKANKVKLTKRKPKKNKVQFAKSAGEHQVPTGTFQVVSVEAEPSDELASAISFIIKSDQSRAMKLRLIDALID